MSRYPVILLMLSVSTVFCASFQGIGDLPGGTNFSDCRVISANGTVVAGTGSSASTQEAIYWTQQGGIQRTGLVPGYSSGHYPIAVSADGSLIAGEVWNMSGETVPFLWSADGGIQKLDNSNGLYKIASVRGMSSDGSIISGYVNTSTTLFGSADQPCYWTKDGSLHILTPPINDTFSTHADAVSGDGSKILLNHATNPASYLWSQEGGYELLPLDVFWASWLSYDGQILAGTSRGAPGTNIYFSFYWSQTEGLTLIDTPAGWLHSFFGSMTPDAKFAVGQLNLSGNPPEGGRAYLWDDQNGTRLLEDVLANDYSINLDGWTLLNATGISADGMTICGYGINPDGNMEGWVATIPEPASLLLLAAGTIIFRSRK